MRGTDIAAALGTSPTVVKIFTSLASCGTSSTRFMSRIMRILSWNGYASIALRKEGTGRLYNTMGAKGVFCDLGMSHVISALISKWEPSD